MPAFGELKKVVDAFNDGRASQQDLDTAQAQYRIDKRQHKHNTKISDAAALKTPWKPVVEVTENTSAGVVSAINRLTSIVQEQLGVYNEALDAANQNFQLIINGITGVQNEIINLRRVS
jgi:adenosyl cobinamide kinase/adenosyl cobinamide phosphate guanylyltransferase